jgi:hypothetical protein
MDKKAINDLIEYWRKTSSHDPIVLEIKKAGLKINV